MKRILDTWHAIDDVVQKLERALISLFLLVILVAGMLNIFLRIINKPEIVFVGILLKQLTIWLGLLGAMAATASAEHLNVDAFGRLLKKRGMELNNVVIGVCCVLFSTVLTYYAFKFFSFQGERLKGELVGGGRWAWLWVVIFPISFVVMTLRYFFQTIEHGGVLFSPDISDMPVEAEHADQAEEQRDAEAAESSEAAESPEAAEGSEAAGSSKQEEGDA